MAKIAKAEQHERIGKLFVAVFSGDMTMTEARLGLRAYMNALTAEDKKSFIEQATPRGRHLYTVAEAFAQELTVIGAGQ